MMWTALMGLGGIALYILPGSWVAFTARESSLRPAARLALAVVLSPLVLAAEFMLLRSLGVPFETVAVVLPPLNLPALLLVGRAAARWPRPRAGAVVQWFLILTLLVGFICVFMGDVQVRGNHGHAWLHTDIIYMLAAGPLPPEEPQLAGRLLAYPWLAHIQQAVISYLFDTAPNSGYLLTNAVWLVAVIALMAEITARCGGDRVAQMAAAVLLSFGVNAAGYIGRLLGPEALVARFGIWGDPRYTPWLRKFGIFEPTVFGIGLFAAIAAVLMSRGGDGGRSPHHLLLAALVLSAALLYPVLFPASLALVGASVVLLLVQHWRSIHRAKRAPCGSAPAPWREAAALIGIGALGVIALAGSVAAVTVERAGSPSVATVAVADLGGRLVTAIVVLAPLLVGALAWRTALREHWYPSALLLLASLPILGVYLLFDILYWSNEYKFIFAAAICLTPFAAVTAVRLLAPAGRAAVPLGCAAALALMSPALHRLWVDSASPAYRPQIDASRFDLRLRPDEPFAAVTDAVRRASPATAVLVARTAPLDWVALTGRASYVAPGDSWVHGLGMQADFLLKRVRDYPAGLVDERRATVLRLFDSDNAEVRAAAVRRMMGEMGRPLVVIALPDDRGLLDWLSAYPGAGPIHVGRAASAWLLPSRVQ